MENKFHSIPYRFPDSQMIHNRHPPGHNPGHKGSHPGFHLCSNSGRLLRWRCLGKLSPGQYSQRVRKSQNKPARIQGTHQSLGGIACLWGKDSIFFTFLTAISVYRQAGPVYPAHTTPLPSSPTPCPSNPEYSMVFQVCVADQAVWSLAYLHMSGRMKATIYMA